MEILNDIYLSIKADAAIPRRSRVDITLDSGEVKATLAGTGKAVGTLERQSTAADDLVTVKLFYPPHEVLGAGVIAVAGDCGPAANGQVAAGTATAPFKALTESTAANDLLTVLIKEPFAST